MIVGNVVNATYSDYVTFTLVLTKAAYIHNNDERRIHNTPFHLIYKQTPVQNSLVVFALSTVFGVHTIHNKKPKNRLCLSYSVGCEEVHILEKAISVPPLTIDGVTSAHM